MNQLSSIKDFAKDSRPKNNNNAFCNKPSSDFKYKESNYKNNSNSQNLGEENKQEITINKPSINLISRTPHSKSEIKNDIENSSDMNNKRRENEKKDIKDISDFIKNKKNDKK